MFDLCIKRMPTAASFFGSFLDVCNEMNFLSRSEGPDQVIVKKKGMFIICEKSAISSQNS